MMKRLGHRGAGRSNSSCSGTRHMRGVYMLIGLGSYWRGPTNESTSSSKGESSHAIVCMLRVCLGIRDPAISPDIRRQPYHTGLWFSLAISHKLLGW